MEQTNGDAESARRRAVHDLSAIKHTKYVSKDVTRGTKDVLGVNFAEGGFSHQLRRCVRHYHSEFS